MKKIALSDSKRTEAFWLALVATSLWGLSGTVAQILFQKFYFPPEGLVTLRLAIAGSVLFAWLRPNWPRAHAWQIVAYSVLGILPSQLFYFLAINYSNAAIATLLQILFLPIVVFYEILTHVYKLSYPLVAAISLALAGALLLIGAGWSTLTQGVTTLGLIFGLLCPFAAAYYTLASKKLIGVYGSWSVTTWGFVIAGFASLPIGIPSLVRVDFSSSVVGLVLFVAFFGTLFTYGLYVRSLERLTGTEASITATGEPITAAVASYLLLDVVLTDVQYLGAGLILSSLLFLGRLVKKPPNREKVRS